MEDPNRHVLDYANPRTLKVDANRVLWIAAGIAGVVLFFVVVILPESNRARPSSQRLICSRNLRQIGQTLLIYANDSDGVYPNRIEDLLLTQNTTSDVFTCPVSGDVKATGPNARAVAMALTTGGHLSYLYLGRGLRRDAPADTVLACEWLSNHDG